MLTSLLTSLLKIEIGPRTVVQAVRSGEGVNPPLHHQQQLYQRSQQQSHPTGPERPLVRPGERPSMRHEEDRHVPTHQPPIMAAGP